MKYLARLGVLAIVVLAALVARARYTEVPGRQLKIGFAEADVTPVLGRKPVYIAGFGFNRVATGVHDPIMARAVVIEYENRRFGFLSVDVVGLFRDQVLDIRKRLPSIHYLLVSSTHNHEGPDTLGLWGPLPVMSGVDRAYMQRLADQCVRAVEAASVALEPARAVIGTVRDASLVRDSREPYIKHDELTALQFHSTVSGKLVGTIVGWNCHPETLDSKNTLLSADFVGYTVDEVKRRTGGPVLYLTGTVGGLMTSLGLDVRDESGGLLQDGTFAKTERYGRLIGQLAMKALGESRPVDLAPVEVRSREVYLPLYNQRYKLARSLGILKREEHVWTGDWHQAPPVPANSTGKDFAVATEIGWLRLGGLEIAAIPGEIYPELVLSKVQDPVDQGADFPDAPIEPGIYAQLKSPHRLLIGLANDELGYIIPKRQWDEKPPYCYGRKKKQYGEENSVGPETAPILCRAFQDLVAGR
jgi:hypothetical protein